MKPQHAIALREMQFLERIEGNREHVAILDDNGNVVPCDPIDALVWLTLPGNKSLIKMSEVGDEIVITSFDMRGVVSQRDGRTCYLHFDTHILGSPQRMKALTLAEALDHHEQCERLCTHTSKISGPC